VSLQLIWGLRATSHEVTRWRSRARCIPETGTRGIALGSLLDKRPHLDGAALFWTLPRRRSRRLLSVLVAYEAILEFLDDLDERAASAEEAARRQLHRALAEAVSLDEPISNYYLYHPRLDDGGYLRAQVELCRRHCASLPSYPAVGRLLVREASRAQVLALNHSAERREVKLKEWVQEEIPGGEHGAWFEWSGAATASLTVHALLTLAADSRCVAEHVNRVQSAYFPWLSLTATMLDSYVDQPEDNARGSHNYINHYPSFELAIQRIEQLIRRSAAEASNAGHRHTVILACMIAMYASRDSARTRTRRATSRRLVVAGGSLTCLLRPALRAWRTAYALRSA
jgi:tetraprenyl-beta-curcumene synthase